VSLLVVLSLPLVVSGAVLATLVEASPLAWVVSGAEVLVSSVLAVPVLGLAVVVATPAQ
jgi:hypothetical protein